MIKLVWIIHLNNTEASDRLIHRWTSILKASNSKAKHIIPFSLYPRNQVPVQAVGHQCGTCRFGADPKTSVLDLNCRTHDVENLYVVDGSFFPSNSGVNPTLTIYGECVTCWGAFGGTVEIDFFSCISEMSNE